MPFRYRLQKILEFRIRKKEEQETVVQKAQRAVNEAQANIDKNNDEIVQTILAKRQADYRMMEYYDKYLHHLWDKAEELQKKKTKIKMFSELGIQRHLLHTREVKEEEADYRRENGLDEDE